MSSHTTSEDTESSTHGGRPVLVRADIDPGDSSSSDDRSLGNHQATYSSSPRSIPSIAPQSPYCPANEIAIPPNIISLSNSTLSSSSSQSFNAVESTPPSGTPGQAALPDIAPTPFTYDDDSSVNDHPDLSQHSRIQQISDKSGQPRRGSLHRRPKDSKGSLHFPTLSCNLPSSERVIMVTYDCHPFTTVDVTPATSAAFVWERIFTELKIPDDDRSSGFAIFRTQVNRVAVGEALNNVSLLQLIKDQGDGEGNLKFLVCHPHARVNEPSSQGTLTLHPYRRDSMADKREKILRDTDHAVKSTDASWTRAPTGLLVDKAHSGDGTLASDEITTQEQESLLVRRASRSSPRGRVPHVDPHHQSHLASNSVSKFGDIPFKEDESSGTTLPLSLRAEPYTSPTTPPATPPRNAMSTAISPPSTPASSNISAYAPFGTIVESRQDSLSSGQDTLSELALRPSKADKVICDFRAHVAAQNLLQEPNLSVDAASSSDDCAGATTALWSRRPVSQLVREDKLGSPRSGPRPTLEVITQNINDLGIASSNFGVSDHSQLQPRLRDPRPYTPPDGHKSAFEEYTWAPRPPPEDVYDRLEEFFPEHDLDKPVIEASRGFSDCRPRTPQDGHKSTVEEYTWSHRLSPEDVYDRLEEFFPEHDLDKPIIEVSSTGASPTIANPSHGFSSNDRESPHVRGKKSIRFIAEEYKKRLDRTSRGEPSLLRRNTKLWGEHVEEVTTSQTEPHTSTPVDTASSGGPRPIVKWVRGELIGSGTFGRVYLAMNATTGEMFAVKQVEIPTSASDKNDSRQVAMVQALKMESETLKDLDHPHIVAYLGFEETPKVLSIFLEYVPGGSIGSCLRDHGRLDEEVTKSFTAQILDGLAYLHSKNIIHRNLTADSILVEKAGICKISDFGISKRVDDDQAPYTPMQGNVFWMAPEVIGSEKGKSYDAKVDIWSVGCVVSEMWTGRRPWPDEDFFTVMFKVSHEGRLPPIPSDVILSDGFQG